MVSSYDEVLCNSVLYSQVRTREPDVTRLPSYVAHLRLEGHSCVNPISHIVVDSANTYTLYRTWNPERHSGPRDLQALLQSRKRLPETHCRLYFKQIASLVRDAHRRGIVLRDLKLRKFVFRDDAR
jgi:tribbles-like protein